MNKERCRIMLSFTSQIVDSCTILTRTVDFMTGTFSWTRRGSDSCPITGCHSTGNLYTTVDDTIRKASVTRQHAHSYPTWSHLPERYVYSMNRLFVRLCWAVKLTWFFSPPFSLLRYYLGHCYDSPECPCPRTDSEIEQDECML